VHLSSLVLPWFPVVLLFITGLIARHVYFSVDQSFQYFLFLFVALISNLDPIGRHLVAGADVGVVVGLVLLRVGLQRWWLCF